MMRAVMLSLWVGVMAQAGAATVASGNPFEELYLRATNEFAQAHFFKPAELPTADLSCTLAPMIVAEVRGQTGLAHPQEQFGTLSRSNGVLTVDTSRPAVYVGSDTVQRKQTAYAQLIYLWVYAGEALGPSPSALGLQGVRITLDSSGQPGIWEVLTEHSGAELLFVSQRLETAALAEFGKPLPGRRYAIERSRSEVPLVVVARVLDDAPAVMGPMVYLSAGTHDASTLICRCMPAQVKALVGTSTYTLVPFPAGRPDELLNEARTKAKAPTAFWPGERPGAERLENCLRLPSSF